MPYNIFMLLGYRRMWWNNSYYCLGINILDFPGDIDKKPDSQGRERGQGLHAGKSRLCRWFVHTGSLNSRRHNMAAPVWSVTAEHDIMAAVK